MPPHRLSMPVAFYDCLIATGGIASGPVFELNEDATLGREERRRGHLLDRRDHGSMHIVCFYMKLLLGGNFAVFPIGLVGDDDAGRQVQERLSRDRLNLKYLRPVVGKQTQFSLQMLYPEGTGGMLISDDAASNAMTPEFIERAEGEFANYAETGIALALADVPLEARMALLRLAAKYDFLRVATLAEDEIGEAIAVGLLREIDLLAIDIEEAAALVGCRAEGRPAQSIVDAAMWKLHRLAPELLVAITAGRAGSWVWDGHELSHEDICDVETVSTVGAGSAHLAGLLTGLCARLTLPQAQQLGVLVAGLSAASPHGINDEVKRDTLWELAAKCEMPLYQSVARLLHE